MGKTTIEWCDHSINPLRFGSGHYCQKISPGCAACYASRLQPRFGNPEFGGAETPWLPFVIDSREGLWLDESKLQEVLRRKKPTRYFWADMTDLFGSWVPDEWIIRCFDTMRATLHHTHLVLTKRPERMRDVCSRLRFDGTRNNGAGRMWLAANADDHEGGYRLMGGGGCTGMVNVWLGVSVENQQYADERIPLLLETPAAVRFLSCEPLLGPVDVSRYLVPWSNLAKVDWVIAGGESGPRARPCDLAWVRSLVRQCKAAEVPVFVKQLGSNIRGLTDSRGLNHDKIADILGSTYRLKDSKGGDITEFPEDLQVREFP